tara:strand:+ start:374 stop:1108 length:735 start_codon:yes stop_codon:yes gene_type:complete
MIAIKDIYKGFNNNIVLNGINIQIPENQILTIIGPNGSGKTTLIKSILGMLIIDKGDVLINGTSITDSPEYRNKISYLPQAASFPPNLKVVELLKMIKNLRDRTVEYYPLLDHFNLHQYLNEKISSLSQGTRQKINLVITFMFNAPILILDEPTAGLDPISVIKVKELIQLENSNGKTILVTSHIMSFIEEISDKIIFLLDGKVYFNGTVSKLKSKIKRNRTSKEKYLTDFEFAIATILENKNV